MARRLKALLLLFVIGLVLPAAGSPHRFCTSSWMFVSAGECCETPCASCPENPDDPLQPGCVTASKLLPDGTGQHHFHLPEIQDVSSSFPTPPAGTVSLSFLSGPPARYFPPDPVPIYLANRSMLL